MGLNKAGGILMLISLFLPALILLIDGTYLLIWMFGFAYGNTGGVIGTGFIPDFVGIIFFIIILIFSILCIAKNAGKTKVFGILSIVFIVIYYIWWFIVGGIIAIFAAMIDVSVLVVPFIGFFGILIGSILNIAAK